MNTLADYSFAPVMDYPEDLHVFDLSEGYDPELIRSKRWGIGKYNEKRPRMYRFSQYEGKRNIHMGIDIWAKAGEPVYSFYDGIVAYMQDHNQPGNYGPAIVIRYLLDGEFLYALYGHLSRESLEMAEAGESVKRGQKIAELGSEAVNGGWVPHLHFQLSVEDPGEADMPGVVSEQEHKKALKRYPDPRLVLGDIY